MYCYGGNNPVRYVDPDGSFLINYSSKYILAKLESSVVINEKEIDTLVIPPHSIALGNFDGVYTQSGTYYKVSGFDTQVLLSKFSEKLSDNLDISFIGQINFAVGDDSMIVLSQCKNNYSDFFKLLFNAYSYIKSLATKEKYKGKLFSGSYRKDCKDYESLKSEWEKTMKGDLEEYYDGNWKDAFFTDEQKGLRTNSKYKIWSVSCND